MVFAQLLVFTDCTDIGPLLVQLDRLQLDTFLFKDLNDPQGVGLLTLAENADDLALDLRDLLAARTFRVLMQRHELTVTGRSMARNNAAALREVINNPAWPWVVWHPIRATTGLLALDDEAQSEALAALFDGAGDVGNICLKSHGLHRAGCEFVHGVFGPELAAVSDCIESMRRAEPHDAYVAATGPFFVGRSVRQGDAFSGPKARW